MDDTDAIKLIMAELARARAKHPHWPPELLHQAAIVAEESGELIKAAVECHYEGGAAVAVDIEATHTAATCVRLLVGR